MDACLSGWMGSLVDGRVVELVEGWLSWWLCG